MKGPLAYVLFRNIAATVQRWFESDRRQRLFLPLFFYIFMHTYNGM